MIIGEEDFETAIDNLVSSNKLEIVEMALTKCNL